MTFKCHYKNCAEEDDQYAKTGASIDGKYYCEAHYDLISDQFMAQAILDGFAKSEAKRGLQNISI